MSSFDFFRECSDGLTLQDRADAVHGAKIRAIVFSLACLVAAVVTAYDLFVRGAA